MSYDRDLLASKIDWEGGITATLEYGLRSEDIADPDLQAQWQAMERLWDDLRPLIQEFRRSLLGGEPTADGGVDVTARLASGGPT